MLTAAFVHSEEAGAVEAAQGLSFVGNGTVSFWMKLSGLNI